MRGQWKGEDAQIEIPMSTDVNENEVLGFNSLTCNRPILSGFAIISATSTVLDHKIHCTEPQSTVGTHSFPLLFKPR